MPFAFFSTFRRLANCVRLKRRQASEREMTSLRKLIESRPWRWQAVVSAMKPTRRSYTLRELLKSLETSANRDPRWSPYLEGLTALVKDDLASSEHFPERRGGPDPRRPLSAWKARYNHLDRYLRPELAPEKLRRNPWSDDASARALSAAENEGWPLSAPDA